MECVQAFLLVVVDVNFDDDVFVEVFRHTAFLWSMFRLNLALLSLS